VSDTKLSPSDSSQPMKESEQSSPGAFTGTPTMISFLIQEENITYNLENLPKAFEDLTVSLSERKLYRCLLILYQIKTKIFETQGHSRIVNEMETWINRLSPGKTVDERALKIFEATISIWKQKK